VDIRPLWGLFGPYKETNVRVLSLWGPLRGTNLCVKAKSIPGTPRIINIPLLKWVTNKLLTQSQKQRIFSFFCLLLSGLQKNPKEISQWLFEIIHIIRFEMHMDWPDKSENIFWM